MSPRPSEQIFGGEARAQPPFWGMVSPSPARSSYDVIIVGGSLSGSSAALLLKRARPELRVLVLEKSEAFKRRVGEATVEVSAYFLGRVLGLTQHLNDAHLVKQGMRFWFANEAAENLEDSSEIGGRFQVRLPSYQLDRAVFDTEVLKRAEQAGAIARRPANVRKIELRAGGRQIVTWEEGDQEFTADARWVLDASGVASLLARREGWRIPNERHPTSAVWARWRGVKDLDGSELAAKYPKWAAKPYGIRSTATNHVVGDGWWSWWIPLRGGDTSIGLVMDQRLADWPRSDAPLAERMRAFLIRHPVARELLAGAEIIEGDVHWRKNLAYTSDRYLGNGFALLGDAAAFLDPLYSPGMDMIAFTVSAAVEIITKDCEGEEVTELVATMNSRFVTSFQRWFEAIYQDKYEYVGDYELMRLAFNLDLGFYYLGVVSQPFRQGTQALLVPPFSAPPSVPIYYLMRFYNCRLAAIARRRRQDGRFGAKNSRHLDLVNGFTFSGLSFKRIADLLAQWGWLELRELFARPAKAQPALREDPVPEVVQT